VGAASTRCRSELTKLLISLGRCERDNIINYSIVTKNFRVQPGKKVDRSSRPTTVIACDHFRLWRLCGDSPFTAGQAETPRVLVGLCREKFLSTPAEAKPDEKSDGYCGG